MEDTCKLHTNDAGTDDCEALRQGVELEETCGIDDTGIILTPNEQPLGLRTRCDDDMVSGIGFSVCANHGDSPPVRRRFCTARTVPMIHERGILTDKGDVGMSEDALHPCTELRYDQSHAFTSLSKGRRVDVGFRGNAADV